MDRWVEGADWIIWQLCGRETRNTCTAGYKAIHQDGGYPAEDYLRALDERFGDFVAEKIGGAAVAARRPGRRPHGAGRRVDRAARGDRGRRRQRRRPRHRAGRAAPWTPARC